MRKQLGLLVLFAASIHVGGSVSLILIKPPVLLQACLSVAYMSPMYQDAVFGDPVEASVYIMEGETESLNRTTFTLFGTEKMKWRGECFLMTGDWLVKLF